MLIHLFCGAFGVIRKHELFWIERELGKAEKKTRILSGIPLVLTHGHWYQPDSGLGRGEMDKMRWAVMWVRRAEGRAMCGGTEALSQQSRDITARLFPTASPQCHSFKNTGKQHSGLLSAQTLHSRRDTDAWQQEQSLQTPARCNTCILSQVQPELLSYLHTSRLLPRGCSSPAARPAFLGSAPRDLPGCCCTSPPPSQGQAGALRCFAAALRIKETSGEESLSGDWQGKAHPALSAGCKWKRLQKGGKICIWETMNSDSGGLGAETFLGSSQMLPPS